MKPTQADMLLRIAENTFADGDEVMAELAGMRRKLAEHARRVIEDEELLIKAWEVNQQDKSRFAQYMPQDWQSQAKGRAALGQTLSQQRAAIGVVKDYEKEKAQERQGERQDKRQGGTQQGTQQTLADR